MYAITIPSNKVQPRLKAYYRLTKPGIIYGNSISVVAGFFLASGTDLNIWRLLAVLVGTSLVIGSGCVLNNYIDRGIDAKMVRTKKRALVTKEISVSGAITFGAGLGILGFLILALFTNALTVLVGLVGLFFYVVMYGVWKRRSPFGTVVGSVSGSMPPVAGYVAVTGRLDAGAALLFLILTFWQMPHFYAIAMNRHDDYKAASIPVLPVVKGMHITKVYILLYIVAFTVACILTTVLGYTGYVFAVVSTLLGAAWLWRGIQGFAAAKDNVWAGKMFGFSLIVLLVLCTTMSFDALLP